MKILIPGSFDPPTNGHIDVIKRCSKIFTEILVGVVVSEIIALRTKRPMHALKDTVGPIHG